MWEDRRVSGEDGRGGRGKIKKRGREREGGKGEKEKENNCIQNVIIKKQKDIATGNKSPIQPVMGNSIAFLDSPP